MRKKDDAFLADQTVGSKIRQVLFQFSAFQCGQHIGFVNQLVSGEIQKNGSVLHLTEYICIKHSVGRRRRGNVNRYIVTFRQHFRGIVHNIDAAAERMGRFCTEERVIADNLHPQICSAVRHHHTDSAQTVDT